MLIQNSEISKHMAWITNIMIWWLSQKMSIYPLAMVFSSASRNPLPTQKHASMAELRNALKRQSAVIAQLDQLESACSAVQRMGDKLIVGSGAAAYTAEKIKSKLNSLRERFGSVYFCVFGGGKCCQHYRPLETSSSPLPVN